MYQGLGARRGPSVGRARQRAPKRHASTDVPWEERSAWYELRPFRGMYADVRRRLPFYLSDWFDALKPSNVPIVVASVVHIFFINLMPAIAYVLDMYDRTDGSYGVNEVILASALAAVVFSLFSAQPLTFVGVTGLTNLMNYTVYDIAHNGYGLDRFAYLRLQCWMLIWAAGFHFLVAIFNLCDYTRFITDMTADTFGLYVGVIYVQKGIELLVREFGPEPLDSATGWLAVTIAVLFSVTVYFATLVGASTYLPFQLRRIVGQLAFVAGCLFWTGFAHFPGRTLRDVPVSRLPITKSFFPTLDRPWLVDFWNSDVSWVFVGAPLGFLLTLLFYFDHNVSSVMAQARKFPITKPAGFHWDFFLLGITTFVSGILGLPVPNGLVPQAPYNTDSLAVYTQERVTDEEQRGRSVSASSNASLLHITHFPNVRIARVVEQRLSHFAIALLTIGAMTRPILVALGTMPRAVFAGVFLLVGWASIESNPIVTRTLSLLQDRSAVPISPSARPPLMQLPRVKIALFVGIQWLFFAMTIAISQTIAAIGFPVIIILMIPCRVYCVPPLFSKHELEVLDAQTANAPAVLRSLGVAAGGAEARKEASEKEAAEAEASETKATSEGDAASVRTAQPAVPLTSVTPATPQPEKAEQSNGDAQGRSVRPVSSNATLSSNATGSRLIETFDMPSRRGSQRSYSSSVAKMPEVRDEDEDEPEPKDAPPQAPAPKKASEPAPKRMPPPASKPTPATSTSTPAAPNSFLSWFSPQNTPVKRVRITSQPIYADDSSVDEPREFIRVENPPRGPGKGVAGVQWRK